MSISLSQALRSSSAHCIAFIGSGGKTTAMFQLAKELAKHTPVVVTASSHLGVWQVPFADRHLVMDSNTSMDRLMNNLHGITLVTGEVDGDRTKPVPVDLLHGLDQFCKSRSIPLLVEADGSRGRPVKAWADHEPPIPAFADLVVEVVGLSGIGKPLNEKIVHRPELFSELTGLKVDEVVTANAVLQIITHSSGGQKNIPDAARKIVLLNQADTFELQSLAHGMKQGLLSYFHSVVISSLKQDAVFAVHEPVAGIVLAAGGSTRYGQPKQLLEWMGESFVRMVAKTALDAGLDPVVVVTGAHADQVEAAVADLRVTIARNEEWMSGQGTSIRCGVQKVAPVAGSCIFLLVDQPQVNTLIVQALAEKHAKGLHPIVAPMVIDRRANPVLFDRVTFEDLTRLDGDVGGRAIFHKHSVEYVPWHDDRLLLDVDTPEQYQRLLADDTL